MNVRCKGISPEERKEPFHRRDAENAENTLLGNVILSAAGLLANRLAESKNPYPAGTARVLWAVFTENWLDDRCRMLRTSRRNAG